MGFNAYVMVVNICKRKHLYLWAVMKKLWLWYILSSESSLPSNYRNLFKCFVCDVVILCELSSILSLLAWLNLENWLVRLSTSCSYIMFFFSHFCCLHFLNLCCFVISIRCAPLDLRCSQTCYAEKIWNCLLILGYYPTLVPVPVLVPVAALQLFPFVISKAKVMLTLLSPVVIRDTRCFCCSGYELTTNVCFFCSDTVSMRFYGCHQHSLIAAAEFLDTP